MPKSFRCHGTNAARATDANTRGRGTGQVGAIKPDAAVAHDQALRKQIHLGNAVNISEFVGWVQTTFLTNHRQIGYGHRVHLGAVHGFEARVDTPF